MTVYADTKGNFKKVENLNYFEIQDMRDELAKCDLAYFSNGVGFECFCSAEHPESDIFQCFVDHLSEMPFKLQVKLNDLLLSRSMFDYHKQNWFQNYQDYLSYCDTDFDELTENSTDYSPADYQEDFLEELKEGGENVESPLDTFMAINGWSEVSLIMDFLSQNLPDFRYWYIAGYSQGENTFVWTFDKNNTDLQKLMKAVPLYPHDPESIKYTFSDYLTSVLFGSFVKVSDCNKKGERIKPYCAYVADLYVSDEDNPYSHDSSIDEYMENKYGMKPAKASVTYSI